jgi:NAD(P)-dependent dehydrogenase (short-subunit alcohol dehydrogenase family)
MMTKTAAVEYAAAGGRINCIYPRVTDTALVHRLPQQLIEGATALTALGRIGQPGEMAKAVVFLASEDASFITGAALNADGGYTALVA